MATAIRAASRGDTVEDLLIRLERDFAAIHGPDMATWSKGVRGELIEMVRARRAAEVESHPVHPRKASAGRRRRHMRQLPYRLQQIAPGAVTILVTPIWMDGTGRSVRHYLARALDPQGRIIKFAPGGSQRIASLLQAVHPNANWDHPLTWVAAGNTLTDRLTRKQVA